MRKIVLFILCIIAISSSVFAQEGSIEVNGNTTIQKEHGYGQSIFVHETYYVNPFSQYQIIVEKDGDTILGYRVGGKIFDENHFLFIDEDDSEEQKTIHGWQEIEPGIHKKTILQEPTHEKIAGIHTPSQSVAATSYYRVIYNHDSTPPICSDTLFSHDSAGIKKFELGSNTWFSSEKYISFACFDGESGCDCDALDSTCFIQDESVFSSPQAAGYNSVVSNSFANKVGLETSCDSGTAAKILYDTSAPDINFSLNNSLVDTSDTREYISNDGVLYDGIQIPEKRFYNIKNTISLKADSDTKIDFELYDLYDNQNTQEGVSGLKSYNISVSKDKQGIWSEIGSIDEKFDAFNPQGNKQENDTRAISSDDISFLKSAFTKIGSYQIYILFEDLAGNQARVILYFDIVPDTIDAGKSFVESAQRNTVFADNNSYYDYSMYLRDKYNNPIAGKQVYNLEYTCGEVNGCVLLRQNMLSLSPSGDVAIEIFDQDLFSDENGVVSFKVKSIAPGTMTELFAFEMFDWDESYKNIFSNRLSARVFGTENDFLQLFSGVLETRVNNTWGNEIPLGEELLYRMKIQKNTPKDFEGDISDFTNYITSTNAQSTFTLSGSLDFDSDKNVYFSGTMITTLSQNEHDKIGLEISENNTSAIEISYVLGGRKIQHYLSKTRNKAYPVSIKKYVGMLDNPVKIIGNLQGVGNSQNSFERQNISDISSSTMRNILRKNVGLGIRLRKHNTTVGGVKYIDASKLAHNIYTLESNPSFETLVVHNGNIHINSDFVSGGDMIGLISYIDPGYSVQNGYSSIGNIYVDNDVSQIHAAIYADGALISTDNKIPIVGDDSTRSSLLQKQLYIKGSLFTRNTLGGATLHEGKYVLPGGEQSSNQELTLQYDFHHIRRGASECIQESGSCLYSEYFIIEYNPTISSKPPTFFEMR